MDVPELTAREVRILEALADGATSKDMVSLVGRSKGTIESDIRALFGKFSARSRHHLVGIAFQLGILSAGSRTPVLRDQKER
jgi:DNA-binding CsgD family transcriptional regulator